MRIQRLELNNFGKFSGEVFEFEDGIQIIYGRNEAGKTTLHTFIKGMLFGLERGRGKAALNDTFSRYTPWENPSYYAGALNFECGGKAFRLERNFDKHTKKASLVCLNDGEELSVEDGDLAVLLDGLTKAGYEDTLCIGQLRAKPGQTVGDELKNYAVNYYLSGEEEINLAKAAESLKKRRKEVEGRKKKILEKNQEKREQTEQETDYVWHDLHKLKEELENVEEELKHRENGKEGAFAQKKTKGKRVRPLELAGIAAGVVLAFACIARPWNFLIAIVISLMGSLYVWNHVKEEKGEEEGEAALSKETPSVEKLLWEREHLKGTVQEKQARYENLKEKLGELDELTEDFKEEDKKGKAIDKAARRLKEVSFDMQRQMSRDLNKRASQMLREITGGEYSRLVMEEKMQASVMKGERKIPLERVSCGTSEQIYFALRMAAADLLYEEDFPLMLDDTFAFYDDVRLENTLRRLGERKGQTLLFTCQEREREILERLDIRYAQVRLS